MPTHWYIGPARNSHHIDVESCVDWSPKARSMLELALSGSLDNPFAQASSSHG